jgi:hypothetical protein
VSKEDPHADLKQHRLTPEIARLAETSRALSRPPRRERAEETFARIPHERGLALFRRLNCPACVALVELDRLILTQPKNPVIFWSPRLRQMGLTHGNRRRALRQLEALGVVEIEHRGSGLGPLVTSLWHPPQG